MPSCDMCGKNTDTLKALVEGVQMDVCRECAKFGKIVKAPDIKKILAERKLRIQKKEPEAELVESIVDDYADKIRRSREKMGLTQEEFARMVNERESILQKMETNQFRPPLNLARKLERVLGIKLIEEIKAENTQMSRAKSDALTIGDIMAQKK